MRKVVFILAIVLAGVSGALAQTEKGRWTAGVSVGNFSYQVNNSYRTFSANLTPSAGYFVANNLLIGTGVPFGTATAKSGDFYKSTSSSIGLSPFVWYYFGTSSLKPYVGLALAYSYSRSSNRRTSPGIINEEKSTGQYSSLSPSVGLAYFVNRNVALNAGLSYNFQYSTFRNESSGAMSPSEGKYDNKSLSLGIGFQLFFGK